MPQKLSLITKNSQQMPPDGCFLFVLSPTGPKPQVQQAGLSDSCESLELDLFCDSVMQHLQQEMSPVVLVSITV